MKRDNAYNWIRIYIDQNKFSDNTKIPSENYICAKLNLSRSTVREALDRIEKEGFIYKIRGSGTYINRKLVIYNDYAVASLNTQIGMILQGYDGSANNSLINGAKSVFQKHDYGYSVFFTDNKFSNERFCLETVMYQGFSGFIVDGVKSSLINPNLDCYNEFYQKKIPFIFYNNYYRELKYPIIASDEHTSAYSLVAKLVEAGHRNIAGIFVSDNYQSLEKLHGFAKTLQRHEIKFDDNNIKLCISHEAYDERFIKQVIKFLKSVPKCTAIVCGNYLLLGIIQRALAEMNKSIPRDYSVVCFDYSGVDWEKQSITCSIHPGFEIGKLAAENIISMIENKEFNGAKYSHVVAPSIYDGTSIAQL